MLTNQKVEEIEKKYMDFFESLLQSLSSILITLKEVLATGTSNHMFGSVIWDKLPECIFENFETALVKWQQLQNFKNHERDISQKSHEPNMWLLVNHTKSMNSLYWN